MSPSRLFALWCAVVLAACARQTPADLQHAGQGLGGATAQEQRLPTPFELPPLPPGPAKKQPLAAAPPLQLTSADGAGLQLRKLEVRAVVEGPLVLTELHATFHNAEDRVREGRFELVLPDGAALSRFAMLQPDGWMEGEVVEKAKAQRVYEDFLHRRQDPALLQQDAGNTFSARVFPIPARGDKAFVLTWSEELADPRAMWRLPLRGLPKLAEFSARVYVHGAQQPGEAIGSLGATLAKVQVIQVEKRDWQPDDDLRIATQAAGPQPAALRAGQMVAARVQIPQAAGGLPEPFGKAVLLIDTSASLALAWPGQLELADKALALVERGGASDVAVVAFDQHWTELCRGKPAECRTLTQRKLRDRGPLGASNLELGLEAARQAASQLGGAEVRVILLSDGMASAGQTEAAQLVERVKHLGAAGVERLDALSATVARDRELLRALTTAGLARDGQVIDATRDGDLEGLTAQTLGAIAVEVPGASWVWPKELRAARPGEVALIFAELPETRPLAVTLAGAVSATVELQPKPTAGPLLERAWVGARIRLLLHRSAEGDPDLAAAFGQQATALSIRHRVLCPTTALLVLETERDYDHYGIDRMALAQILSVSVDGAAVLEARTPPPSPPGGRDQPPPQEQQLWRWRSPGPQDEGAPAAEPAAQAKGSDPDRAAAPAKSADGASAPDSTPQGFGFRGGGSGGGGGGEGYGRRHGLGALGGGGGSGSLAERRGRSLAPAAAPSAEPLDGTQLRIEVARVSGPGDPAGYQRWLFRHQARLVVCFARAPGATLRGQLTFSAQGELGAVQWRSGDRGLAACAKQILRSLPSAPEAREQTVVSLALADRSTANAPGPLEIAAPQPPAPSTANAREMLELLERSRGQQAVTGELAAIRALLAKKDTVAALKAALAWRAQAPTDALALVALGEALLAHQDPAGAARAFGSLVDLYPQRADIRRFAGNLLETCGPAGLPLALDTYAKAVAQRPDHPSGAVMLALAQARAGDLAAADATLAKVEPQRWRAGNFGGVERGIASLRALFAAARSAKAARGGSGEANGPVEATREAIEAPTLAIVTWETDANDVDSHFFDARGSHGSYSNRVIPGAELYHDITTGYGPEFVAIRPDAAWPLRFFAHYYRMGPMGWGMGRLALVRWDGKALQFDSRPFVLMVDAAHVELGTVAK